MKNAALFKLGLVSISFRSQSVEELIRMVAQAGLDGIEWGGDVHAPHGDLDTARKVREQTEAAGLEVSAYGSYYRFEDCQQGADKGVDPLAALDTAQALGAPTMRVWAGGLGWEEASPEWRAAVARRTRELADEAVKRGLRLDFEFHENSLTDSNESTLQLLQEIDHPAVGAFWQTPLGKSHAYRLQGLQLLLDRVSNIHCNYFGDNPWPGMRLLEEGEADWRDYLDVLEGSGRERWISIEHVKEHALENFAKDAATLKRWVGR